MLPENITCAFKNKMSLIKLEIKVECLYYLEARQKNHLSNFISNTQNLSNKSIITYKKLTTCSTGNSKQIYFLNIN